MSTVRSLYSDTLLKLSYQSGQYSIDMSKAFDTIKRRKILEILQTTGCSSDHTRIVRFLISNRKLKVNINKSSSNWFDTTLGSFQGDSRSGALFITLAGALNDVRQQAARPDPPISPSSLPLESAYADDVDFLDEDSESLSRLIPLTSRVLKDWNLFVNEGKTENTHIYMASNTEVN